MSSAARDELVAARAEGGYNVEHIDAGQGIGLPAEISPAAEVVERLCAGAADLLGSWAFLGTMSTTGIDKH